VRTVKRVLRMVMRTMMARKTRKKSSAVFNGSIGGVPCKRGYMRKSYES
jgi:hypothetical protein